MGKTDKPEKTNNKKQKHFWKDFKAELKKVIWPTRSQVVNNTIIVLVIVLIVTAIVFVLDFAFEPLNTYGINKLKTLVQDTVQTETGNTDEGNSTWSEENNTENNGNSSNETADDTMNVQSAENVSE